MKDYSELKMLAEKATPGPWHIDSHGMTMTSMESFKTVFNHPTDRPSVRHEETGNLSNWRNDWDASYIASANPAAVLALIAEVELLKSNNADMILRNKILRERPDLKPDRIACHSSVVSIQSDLLKLKQENESLKKDAARYQWLRKNNIYAHVQVTQKDGSELYVYDSELDRIVDWAIYATKDHK